MARILLAFWMRRNGAYVSSRKKTDSMTVTRGAIAMIHASHLQLAVPWINNPTNHSNRCWSEVVHWLCSRFFGCHTKAACITPASLLFICCVLERAQRRAGRRRKDFKFTAHPIPVSPHWRFDPSLSSQASSYPPMVRVFSRAQ